MYMYMYVQASVRGGWADTATFNVHYIQYRTRKEPWIISFLESHCSMECSIVGQGSQEEFDTLCSQSAESDLKFIVEFTTLTCNLDQHVHKISGVSVLHRMLYH